MKKLLVFTMLLTTLASLTACKKEIPPELEEQIGHTITVQSPYADTITEKRAYLSLSTGTAEGVVYMDSYYYSANGKLLTVKLPDGNTDVELFKPQTEVNSVCTDPMCVHHSVEYDPIECPAVMSDSYAEFLIDAAESNGQLPVFYYSRQASQNEYEIVRYDTASYQAVRVVAVSYPIQQLMSYNDCLYFTTQTAKEQYELNVVKKTGGNVETVSAGQCYLEMLGADSGGVYCNDEKGNIYAADLDLKSAKVIYTVKETYPLSKSRPAELDMFVEGDYVYFFADFKAETFPWWGNLEHTCLNHSIRRVSLSDPQGDGEVVADEVYEYAVYGVYNGVFYYGPFIVETLLSGEEYDDSIPFYHSKGTIRGVRLDTLETFDAVSDCGLNFERGPYYINDRCIIGIGHRYRDDVTDSNSTILFDFQTGAAYTIYDGALVMKGKGTEK